MDSHEFFLRLMGAVATLSFLFICHSFFWFRQFAKTPVWPWGDTLGDKDKFMCFWTWFACILCGLSLNSIFWHKPWYWTLLLFAVLVGPLITFLAYDHPDSEDEPFSRIALYIALMTLLAAFLKKPPSL